MYKSRVRFVEKFSAYNLRLSKVYLIFNGKNVNLDFASSSFLATSVVYSAKAFKTWRRREKKKTFGLWDTCRIPMKSLPFQCVCACVEGFCKMILTNFRQKKLNSAIFCNVVFIRQMPIMNRVKYWEQEAILKLKTLICTCPTIVWFVHDCTNAAWATDFQK